MLKINVCLSYVKYMSVLSICSTFLSYIKEVRDFFQRDWGKVRGGGGRNLFVHHMNM